MVQNVSTQQPNNFGVIDRIGTTNNGRVIYQVVDKSGKIAGKMSVAQKDCDTFERSYSQIMRAAPKMQAYMQNTPPEKLAKKQKMAKWIMGGGALLGGLWPALKAKGTFKQIALTILGSGAGLLAGMFCSSKMLTPPGSQEFIEASRAISKLDIQPVK